jgi:hypothetical protein
MVSWWPADGNAIDFTGTNNGVLVNGAAFGQGEVGNAFSLTNAAQAIDVGAASNLQLQDFTIETWIRRYSASLGSLDPDPNDYSNAAIFSYGALGYGFFLNNDDRLLLTKLGVDGVFSTSVISDTNFHHVAVTKTNTTVTFYIDGANAGTVTGDGDVFQFSSDAAIGAIGDTYGCSFYGLIDDLAIYTRALSPGEILAIYNASSSGKCRALTIISQPTNQVGLIGASAAFSVAAFGTPFATYQWFFASNTIPGATNATLAFANLQPTNAGVYYVAVSDSSGTLVSSNALLTVVAPVAITSAPTNFPAALGGPATFSVSATGTSPLFYQWSLDGIAIPDATNAAYSIESVGFSNIGLYSIVVSNLWSTSSASASLAFNPQITVNGQLGTNFSLTNASSVTVQISSLFPNATIFYTLDGSDPSLGSIPYNGPFPVTQSATVRAIAYDQSFNSAESLSVVVAFGQYCAPPIPGLVAWWQADGSATDFENVNNGVLVGGAGYGPGEVGQGFSFTAASQGVDVGIATNLHLQNFTIEAWIKRASATLGTLDPNPGDVRNAAFFSYGLDGYGFFLNNDNRLLLTKLGIDGVFSTTTLADTNFHHVAVTKTNSSVTFYIDGRDAGDVEDNDVFQFGSHADIGAIGGSQACTFYGTIDELTIYNRALTSNEIQSVYVASSEGKCSALAIVSQPVDAAGLLGATATFRVSAFGQPPLAYQWLFNATNSITNATNATLTITNIQPANVGSYSVIVYNNSGQVFSSNAFLAVVTTVSITGPTNVAALLGGPASFSVVAAGSPPFSYQWSFNGAAIADATNSTYSIDNVTFSNIGNYGVVVHNQASSASNSAILAFNPQITVNGQLGTNFGFTNVPSATVRISSLFSNATIFYTLDGSTPGADSTLYSGPFSVSQPVIVQAVSFDQSFDSAYSLPVVVTVVRTNTLTVIDAGGGTVSLNPPGGMYLNTQTVQLTATPTSGWTFLGWTGASSSASPVIDVLMASNLTLQAIFGTSVTFSPAQNGSFQINPPLSAFPYGSQIAISALPAPGYYFGLWGGSASSATNPYALTVTNPNPNISALFAALPAGKFSVVVVPNGNGAVSVNPLGNSFSSNSTISITATPQGTNKFYYWTGSVTSSNNPLNNLAVRSNLLITADFSGGAYPVQFSPPQTTSSNILFNLAGAPLQAYDIDASSNLLDWYLLFTVTNTDGSIPVSDALSNASQKFYRAVSH